MRDFVVPGALELVGLVRVAATYTERTSLYLWQSCLSLKDCIVDTLGMEA